MLFIWKAINWVNHPDHLPQLVYLLGLGAVVLAGYFFSIPPKKHYTAVEIVRKLILATLFLIWGLGCEICAIVAHTAGEQVDPVAQNAEVMGQLALSLVVCASVAYTFWLRRTEAAKAKAEAEQESAS